MDLVLFEIYKKEEYIFKNSSLKEVIGSSAIIKYIKEELLQEKLDIHKGKQIMANGQVVLYSFTTKEDGIEFIKSSSEEIIRSFPNLNVKFSRKFLNEEDNFAEKIENLYLKLRNKSSFKNKLSEQVSFGIEEVCKSTGLPATYKNNKELISEEIKTKREFYELYSDEKEMDFTEMIEKGNSYIAVINIKNSRNNSEFISLSEKYKSLINKDKKNNKKYLEDISNLSLKMQKAYDEALDNIKEKNNILTKEINFDNENITIVSKAEDGLKLVRLFDEGLNKAEINIAGEKVKLNSAAGVVFCKVGYPFLKAHKLCEELCNNCLTLMEEKNEYSSMVDWHIVEGENSSSIYEIRKKQYILDDNFNLSMRPLFIDKDDEFNNLDNFKWALNHIQTKVSRNKVKALREQYTKGKNATESFITYYKLNKKFDLINGERCNYGILNNTAVFFDAIEIMDLVKEV